MEEKEKNNFVVLASKTKTSYDCYPLMICRADCLDDELAISFFKENVVGNAFYLETSNNLEKIRKKVHKSQYRGSALTHQKVLILDALSWNYLKEIFAMLSSL